MAAKDLGTKYTCFKCQTRFYDLKKPDPICPRCGADQRQAVVTKPSRKAKEKEPVKVVEPEVEEAAAAEDESDEVEDEEVEDDDEDI